MRIAKIIGVLTINRRLPELASGRYVIAEAFDETALRGRSENIKREKPMPESLVVFDELGAGIGQVIAVSEGAEATMPFKPRQVPFDAYNAAILDTVEYE
ncbi:MAG: carbon dioxide concentrating mechanism protein CcmL [Phycisphaera sp.]|nr:carbon dioxide concentrating mechanism protein CcmL [Phycisphaera sp.]